MIPHGLAFSKWEGLGNDFAMVEGQPPAPEEASDWARQICDRRRGVGADGLVFLVPGPGMIIYNADGSLAQMCGNALRCLGAIAGQKGQVVQFATSSGSRGVRVMESQPWWVEIDMGRPLLGQTATFEGLSVHLASMGNPHAVLLQPPPQSEWEDYGRRMQTAPFAESDGINVEFVTVTADGLRVWVYERGVGPTQACGTGACAAFAVAHTQGQCLAQGRVELPGGVLEIEWPQAPKGNLMMRGPAREVYHGQWTAH